MAWTDPTGHVYAVSEVLTAGTMNTYVEADISFLYGDATWTAPAYSNSWVDNTGTIVGYRHVGTRVALRGAMKSGTMSAAAITFPLTYRPPQTANCSTVSNSAFGFFTVTAAGVLTPMVGSNAYFAFDGCSFDTI